MTRAAVIILATLVASALAVTQEPDRPPVSSAYSAGRSQQTKTAALLNINNFTAWQRATGLGGYGPPSVSGDGIVYPRGTKWVVFGDGFLWSTLCYRDAALTDPDPQFIRVGGNTYGSGNEPGWIVGEGSAARPLGESDPRARIYRIRRDWYDMSDEDLRQDVAENLHVPSQDVTQSDLYMIRDQYAQDWNDWPVSQGAPYIERNGVPGFQRPPGFYEFFTLDSLVRGQYDEPGIAAPGGIQPADQVIWFAFNDLNEGNMYGFAGCKPMGIEGQVTLWGYDTPGALSDMYFRRLRLINKGGALVDTVNKGYLFLDSVFAGHWVDSDLGHFGDDLLGCDTTLQLLYTYNGYNVDSEFEKLKLPPPSVGYALLSGPTIPGASGDTAIVGLYPRSGAVNLPLTSFWAKATGTSISDPPFSYEGALRWWRLLQGYVPDPSTNPWRLQPHPPGIPASKFPLSGDPITRTGWIDGLGAGEYSMAPGSRRFAFASGPFMLAPLDTQEIVLAVVGGLGADRLSSITVMKSNVRAARLAYESLFTVPRAPRTPKVKAVQLDGEIVLEWGSDRSAVNATEGEVIGGIYDFEGYKVYQLPSATAGRDEAELLATFDRSNGVTSIVDREYNYDAQNFISVLLQKGEDTGLKRSMSITRDAFSDQELHNGTEYYFAVTSYNHSPDLSPHAMESDLSVIRVRPQLPFGAAGMLRYGDTVSVVHAQGSGTGSVLVTVADPAASTGETYQVEVDSGMGGITWSLMNTSRGTPLLTGQQLHAGPDDPPIVEGGYYLRVSGPVAPGDIYAYTTPRIDSSLTAQKQSAKRISVYPNPTNGAEYVTFTNLPHKAVFTVYNLAGQVVRRLEKDEPSQFFRWDLLNEQRRQVGSGIYIVTIEMPGIDETKVVKVGVIQSQLYPNLR